MYEQIKPLLFKLDPEVAHLVVESALKYSPYIPFFKEYLAKKNFIVDDALSLEVDGIRFQNPIGLGAGFDKNGVVIEMMPALGFGFTEVGTITPKPQSGNEKPRLFRFPNEESLQNGMGFNNKGVYYLSKNLKKIYPYCIPIGVNIGKNKATPNEESLLDYEKLIKEIKNKCDYMTINISTPNTPNLRDLQNESFIKELFIMARGESDKPIYLKIAPDMEIDTALGISYSAIEHGASGIIATNTSVDYSLLNGAKDFGGISGRAIQAKSREFFQALAKELFTKTTLISVGGIDSAKEAYLRIRSGASLVQVYSALVFHGPDLIKNINLGILDLLKSDGFTNIKDAIGADLR